MARNDVGGTRLFRTACEWQARIESGKPEELMAYDSWLRADPAHVLTALQVQALQVEVRRAAQQNVTRVRIGYRARRIIPFPVRARPPGQIEGAANRARSVQRTPQTRQFLALAATICLFTVALAVGHYVKTTHETARGETQLVILSDGSRVHVNSQTRFRMRFTGDTREIVLWRGEALFDVARDPIRPFRVRVRSMLVEALGTRFNVRSDGDQLSIIVDHGQVRLSSIDSGAHVAEQVLGANEEAVLHLQPHPHIVDRRSLTALELKRSLAWTGEVQLAGITLREAVKRFNRANRTQILIDDRALEPIRIGGSVWLIDPQSFVTMLDELNVADARMEFADGQREVYHLTSSREHAGAPGLEHAAPATH